MFFIVKPFQLFRHAGRFYRCFVIARKVICKIAWKWFHESGISSKVHENSRDEWFFNVSQGLERECREYRQNETRCVIPCLDVILPRVSLPMGLWVLVFTRWVSENQFVTDEAIGNKQRGLKLLEFFCGRSLGVVVERERERVRRYSRLSFQMFFFFLRVLFRLEFSRPSSPHTLQARPGCLHTHTAVSPFLPPLARGNNSSQSERRKRVAKDRRGKRRRKGEDEDATKDYGERWR